MPVAKVPILLADDLPQNLLALQAILDAPDYELVGVASGQDALEALAKREFAVVLLDFRMPDMTGLEALHAIRRTRFASHPTPIILVTAYDVPRATLEEAFGAGAVDFVQKPIESYVLQAKVALFVSLYRARLAAAAIEERFHRLVDAVTDYAIFMLDADGRVATWNRGAGVIKGYHPDEIIGRHFSTFYTPEDRSAGRPHRILEVVRRDGRFEEEGWRVRKDGSRFWANVVITALRDADGAITGFAKVTRDLTARRAAEENERTLSVERAARSLSETEREAAVTAQLELERVNRMKDDFLATMSHELRTPLNAIQGWARILRRSSNDADKLARGLEVIDRNAQAQMRLISDLLDVSRIISGKLEMFRMRTDLGPLVLAAADVVRPAAESKGVRLDVEVDAAIGATVADPDRLQQVIWNLLTNAIRFTPRGGRATIRAARSTSRFILQVQDTGAGIASEHLQNIFDRFVQVDSSIARAQGGLGLGLSIVRHIVEGHGGTVQAESAGLGLGATFTVSLPIPAVSTAAQEEAPVDHLAEGSESDRPSQASNLGGVRLLAVDDDADSLELVRMVLAGAGADVRSATNAAEAIALLDAHGPFDAIVSDIGMPEVDGYTFMRMVRARTPSPPAIALTAYARAEDAERARRAGYQRHLTKPVDEQQLLQTIHSVIHGTRGATPV